MAREGLPACLLTRPGAPRRQGLQLLHMTGMSSPSWSERGDRAVHTDCRTPPRAPRLAVGTRPAGSHSGVARSPGFTKSGVAPANRRALLGGQGAWPACHTPSSPRPSPGLSSQEAWVRRRRGRASVGLSLFREDLSRGLPRTAERPSLALVLLVLSLPKESTFQNGGVIHIPESSLFSSMQIW